MESPDQIPSSMIKLIENQLMLLANQRGYTISDFELITKSISNDPKGLVDFLKVPLAHLLNEKELDERIAHLEKNLSIDDYVLEVSPQLLSTYVDVFSIQNPILVRELAVSYYEKYMKVTAEFYLKVSNNEIKPNKIGSIAVKAFFAALIAHKASNYQDLVSICLACKVHSDINFSTPRIYPGILITHLEQFAATLGIRVEHSSFYKLLVETFTGFKNDFSIAALRKQQLIEKSILLGQSTKAFSSEELQFVKANKFVNEYLASIPRLKELKNRTLIAITESNAYVVLWEFLIKTYELDLKKYKVQLPFAKQNSTVEKIINKYLRPKLEYEKFANLVAALELINSYEEKSLQIISRVGFGWTLFFILLNQSATGLKNNTVGATNVLEYLFKIVTNSYLMIASLWCCYATKKKELDITKFNQYFVPLLEKSAEGVANIFATIRPGKPKEVIDSLSALTVYRTLFLPLSDSPIGGQKRKNQDRASAANKKSKEEEKTTPEPENHSTVTDFAKFLG